jgi:hypothetical protein
MILFDDGRSYRIGCKRMRLILSLLCLFLTAACGPSKEQRALAQRAKEKVADCKTAGDKPLERKSKSLVWDLAADSLYRAHGLLGDLGYKNGGGPVTVFFVSAQRKVQVGTYSISHQPAYREWVDVCVVEFSEPTGDGRVLGSHEVVSLDPRRSRPVEQNPEVGDPAPPVADWIRSLPSHN